MTDTELLLRKIDTQGDKIISQGAQIKRMHTRAGEDSKKIQELLETIAKHKRFLARIRK